MSSLFDFAVITIFAREFLEGTIILGEYRTIIERGGQGVLEAGVSTADAHRAVWMSAWVAIAAALLVIAAIAIPLSVLSRNFDDGTSKIIEGVSKMVAGVCLLQLSLKLPKFLGVYGSCKKKKNNKKQPPPNEENAQHGHEDLQHKDTKDFSLSRDSAAETFDGETKTFPEETTTGANIGAEQGSQQQQQQSQQDEKVLQPEPTTNTAAVVTSNHVEVPTGEPVAQAKLSLRNMRFNVAWNIWREVAECGVFLIPFFLSGDELEVIPMSAVVGSIVGSLMGWGIYVANQRFTDKRALAAFVATLLLVLSAGLFTGGAHNLEKETTSTRVVWQLHGDFWSIDRLPMTVFKPFGYNDSRTVLEMCTYWSWLALGVVLHVRKYQRAPKIPVAKPNQEPVATTLP